MRVFSKKEIESAVEYKMLIEKMKNALEDIEKRYSVLPDRVHMDTYKNSSTFLFMPALSEKLGYLSCKYVGICNDNSKRGLEAVNGVVMLADSKTGLPCAIFDGGAITAARTGALGGAAIDALAIEDAKVASVFGSGAQAKTQIEAMLSVRKIEKIYLFCRNKEKGRMFANRFEIDIEVSDNLRYLEHSDIIIAATNSKAPLFYLKELNLKNHVHINAIGSFKPDMQEIDSRVYESFDVFADYKKGCFEESGDFIITLKNMPSFYDRVKNIGAVIRDESILNRLKNQKTVFKSVGSAVFDLYCCVLLYKSYKSFSAN